MRMGNPAPGLSFDFTSLHLISFSTDEVGYWTASATVILFAAWSRIFAVPSFHYDATSQPCTEASPCVAFDGSKRHWF